jgi:hypothetical protein
MEALLGSIGMSLGNQQHVIKHEEMSRLELL